MQYLLSLFRLLKEMGWQEDSENDETCAPLTEDEMREFQVISEQVGNKIGVSSVHVC